MDDFEVQVVGVSAPSHHFMDGDLTESQYLQAPTAAAVESRKSGVVVYSPFETPVILDERSMLAMVRMQVFADAEQYGIVLPMTGRDILGTVGGVRWLHVHNALNRGPHDVLQREAPSSWACYAMPENWIHARRDMEQMIDIASDILTEVLLHPGAHDEHLIQYAESAFATYYPPV